MSAIPTHWEACLIQFVSDLRHIGGFLHVLRYRLRGRVWFYPYTSHSSKTIRRTFGMGEILPHRCDIMSCSVYLSCVLYCFKAKSKLFDRFMFSLVFYHGAWKIYNEIHKNGNPWDYFSFLRIYRCSGLQMLFLHDSRHYDHIWCPM